MNESNQSICEIECGRGNIFYAAFKMRLPLAIHRYGHFPHYVKDDGNIMGSEVPYDIYIGLEKTQVNPGATDVENLPQLAAFHDFLDFVHRCGVLKGMPNHQNPLLFFRQPDQFQSRLIGVGKRLLYEDVLSGGKELFGDSTALNAGGTAADGFAALAQEDTNSDGVVNNLDANWNKLKVWQDLNQDGISQAGELSTLAQLGITGINVAKTNSTQVLADGNSIKGTGTFIKADGTTGNMADVWFSVDTFTSQFPDEIPVSADVALLPEMEGSGLVRDLQQAAMH